MKKAKIALTFVLMLTIPSLAEEAKTFRELQWEYPRVRAASREKDEVLRQRFKEKGLAFPPRAILLRAFKKEALLELWAAGVDDKPYVLVHEYRICTSSGTLGPKRRFGDEQVPEGFYELDWFNPQSNFFLSLHISYPNASDRILGSHQNPGGDIFLHGNCVTIGCLPITDDGIKELYWLAVLAKTSGQAHLPIQIFPARLTDQALHKLAGENRAEPKIVELWTNLKEGYDYFEKHRRPASVQISRGGKYVFAGE